MKKQNRITFTRIIFLFVALLMFGCKKDEAITPATPELSILGKWQIIIIRSSENGKSTYEYVGKSADYVEITNSDFIRFSDGSKFATQYKVIEKNKKLTLIGSSATGGPEDQVEIRNLTSTSFTLYQEYVKNNITYVSYMDVKK